MLLALAAVLIFSTLADAGPAPQRSPVDEQPFLTGLTDALGRVLVPGTALGTGDRLIVWGQHFGTTVGLVAYNRTPLMVWSWTDAAIVAMIPPGLGNALRGGDLLIQRADGRYYESGPHFLIGPESPVAAPTGLTAAAVLPTQVNLSWTLHSNNELGVEIYRRAGAGPFILIADLSPGSSRFTDWYAARGTSYAYRVRVANDFYASDYTNGASVTTSAETPVAAPSGLTAAAVSPTQVNLSWTLHSNNELGIEIYRKTGAASYLLIADLAPGSSGFTDWRAARVTSYTYRVRVANDFYASDYTNEVTVTTSAATPVAAPTGLTAVAVSSTQVDLSWTNHPSTEIAYELYRKPAGGSYILINDVGPGASSFSDRYAAPGTAYTYRVRAVNQLLVSDYSNEADITYPSPAAPTGLTAVAVSSTQVNLSWTNHPSTEIAYELYRKPAGGTYLLINDVGPGASSFSDLYAAPGTTYLYRVRAVSLSLVSDYSNEMTITTSRDP